MAVFGGPEVITDGLVAAFDAANFKSFRGEPTTNLIPNPTVNAYPTTGNGWGTYNTNQYGSGVYFSIGTVASVSGNVVTMTAAHSLRSYDVMQPQTTGGGVTAGVNYLIKKLSSTTFSLHPYNSSQDGSQGYINPSTGTHKVYDNFANNVQISINSTNFPTMWWGYPHLPNSGLVKEIRYGEFNAIPGLPPNDCIRLHYIRTDDVKDGMSYGVDCSVSTSSSVTISFYTRAATESAVGKVIQYYIYNYTGGSAASYAWNFTLGPVGVWERQSFTYTPAYGTMISYWFPQSSGVYSWDWSCMQVEQKSEATRFVAGTRGTTVAAGGGWKDLLESGNNGELINGIKENSGNGGSLVFDGVDDYIELNTNNIITGTNPFTFECFYTITALNNGSEIFGNYGSGYSSGLWISGEYGIYIQGAVYFPGYPIAPGTYHMAATRESNGAVVLYKNGIAVNSGTLSSSIPANANFRIGADTNIAGGVGSERLNGKIYLQRIYNRALSANEIAQNFNAIRSRFGI